MLGRRSQRDFEDEIRSHLQMEIDRLVAQGVPVADAERAARRAFGNTGVSEDRFYHAQRFAWLEDTSRDLRRAWRSLLRAPGFFAAAVITLALAIGAVAGMFSVVHTVLIAPLAFAQPNRLVHVTGIAPGSDSPTSFGLGDEFYLHFKERSKLIDGLFTAGWGTSTFRAGERAERIEMAWVTNDMFTTLGVHPQVGRLPVSDDGSHAVVISDKLWRDWFARDRSIVGKWYFVSDGMRQIVGVMPSDFDYPNDETMIWMATEVHAGQVRAGSFGPPLVARLKPGVTKDQLAAELTTLAKELPARFGATPAYARMIDTFHAVVLSLSDGMLGPTVETSLLILLGAVAVVLVIACANVANLFVVRAESRRRDLTVRRAIGASRAQLMRSQLAEAFAVALTAGVLAVGLAAVTLPLFLRAAPRDILRLDRVGLDAPTLAVTFGLVLFVALACGIAPALRASSPDLSGLRDGGRSATAGRTWGRDLLVVGQTALALVLLIGAALLLESFQRLRHVNPGYDTRDIYTFQFAPQQPGLHDGPTYGRLQLDVMNRLRALPGVTAVGVVDNVPLDEGMSRVHVRTEAMAGDAQPLLVDMTFSGGDHFRALSIPILQGRAFTNEEAVTPNNSVIVSRAAAEKLWPGQRVLGKRLRPAFGDHDTLEFTVVGVVGDAKQLDWRDAGNAVLYFPLTGPSANAWGIDSPAYVVKSPRAALLKSEVRAIIHDVAPEAPVYREYTMEYLARRSMTQLAFTTLTLGVVSALALVLGLVGLYGVLSYVVAQRTREIGVRMALGATAGAVRAMVVSQGARVVAIGALIGVGAAVASTRLLSTLLFGVKAVDPVVFAAMSAVLLAMGVLACYVPARRASGIDPIVALRSD